MKNHTPGPWFPVGAWVEVEDDNIPDICTCNPEDIGQGHLPRSEEEIRANVELIACAPNMLEALEEILQDACIASEKTDPDEIEEHLETIRMIASRFVLEEE